MVLAFDIDKALRKGGDVFFVIIMYKKSNQYGEVLSAIAQVLGQYKDLIYLELLKEFQQ